MKGEEIIMKKRIISMLLALVIVLGVIAVPAFDSQAASKKKSQVYTKIVLANNKKTEITFTVSQKNKNKAAADLNTLFARMLPKTAKLTCKINGKAAVISSDGKNVYITVDGKESKFKALVKATAKNKQVCEVTFNANTKKVLSALSLAKNGKYTYGVKIGKATLKSFKTKNGKFFFKAYGNEREGYISKGVLYVKGDVAKSAFIKVLKKQGTVKSAKLVKLAK